MADSAEEIAGVREGQIIAGKYRVERLLGVGGMGAVVSAQHLQLGSRFAIKFLLPRRLSDAEAAARFAREAQAAVKITSEHVARVFDVGTLDNGAPFMVMELLSGIDLGAYLAQRGPLSSGEAVDLILQAGEAVAEAHALGVVHRDLKPANLFCTRGPTARVTIKVLDFGISKISGPASGAATGDSILMGSPNYMSPEQIRSARSVDGRTDIWAMGVILYEMLARRMPFAADALPELFYQIAMVDPPPLRDAGVDVPAGLEAVIRKALQRDLERRFRSVGELAAALSPYAPPRSAGSIEHILAISHASLPPVAAAVAPGARSGAAESAGSLLGTDSDRNPRVRSRRGAVVTGVLTTVTALVLAAGIGVLSRRGPPVAGPAPDSTAAAAAPATQPVTPAPLPAPPGFTSLPAPVSPPPITPETGARSPEQAGLSPAPTGAADASSPRHPAVAAPAHPSLHKRPASPEARSGCDPNFYLDAQGEKHFRPECFGVPPAPP